MLTILRSSRSSSISSRTGWTTRQGPHQGAQKSTRTGPSASRTSALKLASVTSVSFPVTGYRSPEIEGSSLNTSESIASLSRGVAVQSRLRLTGPAAAETQQGNAPDRLGDDRAVHLRAAAPAVPKDDRHL